MHQPLETTRRSSTPRLSAAARTPRDASDECFSIYAAWIPAIASATANLVLELCREALATYKAPERVPRFERLLGT